MIKFMMKSGLIKTDAGLVLKTDNGNLWITENVLSFLRDPIGLISLLMEIVSSSGKNQNFIYFNLFINVFVNR